jgi:hypothetical protein
MKVLGSKMTLWASLPLLHISTPDIHVYHYENQLKLEFRPFTSTMYNIFTIILIAIFSTLKKNVD